MTLSDRAIKNPVFSWMLMTGFIVFGWICFNRLGISQLPDVDFPIINVEVTLEGAAPEVMETEVTDVLEDAVISVEGVKDLSSTSRQGSARLTIEFDLSRDIDVALQEVQTKIAQAQRNLPKDIDPPVITKTNPEDQPIMWMALTGDRPLKDLMDFTKNTLKDQFTTVPGVGEVFLGGYVEPSLRVWANAQKLHERELTVEDLIQTIQTQHSEIPAGRIESPETEKTVRIMGEANGVDAFSRLLITSRSGAAALWQPFRISDVATVEDGLSDVRRISRSQGILAVGLGIRKQRGSNAVSVARGVKSKILEIQKNLPKGMELNVVFDTTRFIEESTHELNFTLVLSAILTGIVCYFFLGSWSSTFNVILAIPVSIIGTFMVLYFMGFTLNTFTLLGLSLAIGIVVDDAIMVLENIVRYYEQGHSRVKAAILGAREITSPAIAATVAILAIFVPVIFMKGIIGKYFFQYGVTLSVAVLISLLEALTLAPMRCSQFLQTAENSPVSHWMDRQLNWITERYRKILALCLDNRMKVILISVLVFAISLAFTKLVKKEFVPAQDQSRFLVRLQTEIGSSISYTDTIFKVAEAEVMKDPAVARYFSAVGGFGGGEVNTGNIFITLHDPKKRPIDPTLKRRPSQTDVMARIRKVLNQVPGVKRATVQDLSLSGFSAQRGFPVEFDLLGGDWTTLAELSDTLLKKMEASGLMVDADSNYDLGLPEVRITPDRQKAATRGVSVVSIGQTINALVGGTRVGKYTREGRRYDIRVRLDVGQRQKTADLQRIWLRNNRGELVRLSDVVEITERKSLLSITRKNRSRAITLNANIAPGASQQSAIAAVQKIAKETLPEGYRIRLSGSAQTFKESGQSLVFALIMGIFVAYMVLASQYNSFIHPVTVLLALPFSLTGAFFALYLGHQSLNMFSMIGIILLMGIVKKNSILLVDFTNERRAEGRSVTQALLEACPIRLRPILMTSVTTVAGAIPAAIGFGPGAETRIPMALVVIGGVTVSTLLTLFVVPCAYSLLSRFENHSHAAELAEAEKELQKI